MYQNKSCFEADFKKYAVKQKHTNMNVIYKVMPVSCSLQDDRYQNHSDTRTSTSPVPVFNTSAFRMMLSHNHVVLYTYADCKSLVKYIHITAHVRIAYTLITYLCDVYPVSD